MFAYLLHKLPESERRAFEDRWMCENHLFEQLQDAEADLLDAYARGELSGQDRERVEKYLLGTSAQRQKLHFAQALARTFVPPARKVNWRFIAAIAAAVVLAITTARLAIDNSALRREAPDSLAVRAHAAPVFFAELRSDTTTRSAASAPVRLVLPSDAQVVHLDLQLDAGDETQSLAASLNRDGVEVWKGEPLHPEARAFGFAAPVWIPAANLQPGEYRLTLTAHGSLINAYRFEIVTAFPTK